MTSYTAPPKGDGPIPSGNPADTLSEIQARLLSNMAHALRNPLVAIRGYTRRVLEGSAGEVNARQRQCLEAVLENAERLVRLAADLARLSELEPLRLERFDLGRLLASSCQAVEPLARERGVRLVEQPAPHPLVVAGDRSKLERAIQCLLAGALELVPEGGEVRLECSGADGSREIRVSISSRAFRLPSGGAETLFHPGGGAVQGVALRFELSDASDVIRYHGGEIAFAEEEAGGGAFVLKLPMVRTSTGRDSRS